MPRHVFFSFHFDNDAWRASQVRNSGVIDGNHPVRDNEWEEIKKGGDPAIKKWIDGQMDGRSCAVVLVGSSTYSRPWVKYEIARAWALSKGVVGIRIHKLKNAAGDTAAGGSNPFDYVNHPTSGKKFSQILTLFDSTYSGSTYVYDDIKNNVDSLVEKAIKIRKNN